MHCEILSGNKKEGKLVTYVKADRTRYYVKRKEAGIENKYMSRYIEKLT